MLEIKLGWIWVAFCIRLHLATTYLRQPDLLIFNTLHNKSAPLKTLQCLRGPLARLLQRFRGILPSFSCQGAFPLFVEKAADFDAVVAWPIAG